MNLPPHYSDDELEALSLGWRVEPCWVDGDSSTLYRKNHIILECVHENLIQWVKFTIEENRVVKKEYDLDIAVLLEHNDKATLI